MPDPYETLQVSRRAEIEVIAAAYRTLARKYHPDKDAAPASNKRMQEINAAYEILKDPVQRREYDHEHPLAPNQVGWRSEEAIHWSDSFEPEDWDDWANLYGRRKSNPVPIRRPGFWSRNYGCILYLLLGLFAVYQVLLVVIRKW
jgi:curved DNA-binding protein CbpA